VSRVLRGVDEEGGIHSDACEEGFRRLVTSRYHESTGCSWWTPPGSSGLCEILHLRDDACPRANYAQLPCFSKDASVFQLHGQTLYGESGGMRALP
jgi:hypothetical protein